MARIEYNPTRAAAGNQEHRERVARVNLACAGPRTDCAGVSRLPCFGTAQYDARNNPCLGCMDRVACSRVDSKGVPPPSVIVLDPELAALNPGRATGHSARDAFEAAQLDAMRQRDLAYHGDWVTPAQANEKLARDLALIAAAAEGKVASDGSTASYYELPAGATELQDLIAYRNMNGQDAEMFRALFRKGHCPHSSLLREAKKVLFYAQAEVDRLEKYGEESK